MAAVVGDHSDVVDPGWTDASQGMRGEFGAHLEANYQRLVSELYTMTLDAVLAHDVVQDAFARAWSHWADVRRLPDPTGWIRWTAMRSSRRASGRLARKFGLLRPAGTNIEISPADPRNHVLLHELSVLTVPERRCLVLHYMVGLPIEEVAGLEGTSVATVQARLARAGDAVIAGLSSPPAAGDEGAW